MSVIASDNRRMVVGLGVTGQSCARYFQRRDVPFVLVDTREKPPLLSAISAEFPEAKVVLGDIAEEQFDGITEVVLSPGVSAAEPFLQPARERGIPIVGDIEIFAREVRKPVVAITGSNAKSTVTELIGKMCVDAGLDVAVGGNIGTPVLDLDEAELYILELSSFQLETTFSLKPLVGVLLNISPDHMDRYADLMAYHAAKQRVFMGAENLVFNQADRLTHPLVAVGQAAIPFGGRSQQQLKTFSTFYDGKEAFVVCGGDVVLAGSEMRVKGEHNLNNVAAALTVGRILQLPMETMLHTAKMFTGLPHRCEWVADIDSVTFINDSKGTNVGATIAAIEGLADAKHPNIVLIAGGVSKNADFSALKRVLHKHVRAVVLLGRDAQEIEALLDDKVDRINATNMAGAVTAARDMANAHDVVLLSPACASFDMFSSFEQRGEEFRQAVLDLRDPGVGV